MNTPKKKGTKRKGTKKKEFEVNRRTMLKMGATAGIVTVLTSKKSFNAYAQVSIDEPYDDGVDSEDQGGVSTQIPGEPVICATEPDNSPAHTPFRHALPIPPKARRRNLFPAPTKQRNIAFGEAERADHQRWEEFKPQNKYEMIARPGLHRFHPDYGLSYIWGFNARYPAPTVLNNYNSSSLVRFRNNLPVNTTTFGRNEITIHLHNGHHGSESDGFAGDFFGTGFWKDNLYSNIYAGYDAYPPDGDELEAMHTFWFHDHRAAFTANNNYMGLNGMYFVYDRKDPGHENNSRGSLRLPGIYGVTDIPIILTDKIFCPTANGRTEMFNQVGDGPPGGDKWIVNGAIQPFFQVRRRKYRFRILNTGPAKTWDLSLIKPDGTVGTMVVVATDANFLESPVEVNSTNANGAGPNGALRVSVAERYDVIIDFKEFPIGTKLYLRENAAQFVGMPAPEPLPAGLAIENVLLRFDVVGGNFPPDTPPIPATLTKYPTLPATQRTFEWRFERDPAGSVPRQFKINDMVFDANRVDHCVLRGSTEEWLLNNNSNHPGGPSAWTHPVHIHFEEFRVLKRFVRDPANPLGNVEIPVPPLQAGRKDVMRLNAGESALIKMQFRDYLGRYLIHCHNMGHEDDFMMTRWDIVATNQQLCEQREEIIRQRREAGVDVAAGLPTNNDGKKEGLV